MGGLRAAMCAPQQHCEAERGERKGAGTRYTEDVSSDPFSPTGAQAPKESTNSRKTTTIQRLSKKNGAVGDTFNLLAIGT